jgi:hypothetical protein
MLRIVDEVEDEVFKTHDREVASTLVGSLVTDKLRRVDQIAYVRFASVYRQFRTVEELMDEARAVLDARRFEDPTQGKLFVEPPPADTPPRASNGVNGNENHAPEASPAPKKRRAKVSSESSENEALSS